MREIKFRAWDKKHNRMSEVIGLGWCNVGGSRGGHCLHGFELFEEVCYRVDTNSIILMQYTGLKDKNGKEIYEGDIIRWPGNIIAKVIYEEKYAAFMREWISDVALKVRPGKKEHFAANTNIATEVIGNIYQNPELGDNS